VVPALPVFLLYRLRTIGDISEGSWNRKHLFFLFGGFKPGFEFWEAVVLGRKFLVLSIGVFLADNSFGLQVAAAMWVLVASTVLQLLCKPYQHATEERLETLSLGGTTVAMMIGQVILQADGADGLGARGLALCQGCVFVILLFTMCCFIAFFVSEVRAARRATKQEAALQSQASAEVEGIHRRVEERHAKTTRTKKAGSAAAAAGDVRGDWPPPVEMHGNPMHEHEPGGAIARHAAEAGVRPGAERSQGAMETHLKAPSDLARREKLTGGSGSEHAVV